MAKFDDVPYVDLPDAVLRFQPSNKNEGKVRLWIGRKSDGKDIGILVTPELCDAIAAQASNAAFVVRNG